MLSLLPGLVLYPAAWCVWCSVVLCGVVGCMMWFLYPAAWCVWVVWCMVWCMREGRSPYTPIALCCSLNPSCVVTHTEHPSRSPPYTQLDTFRVRCTNDLRRLGSDTSRTTPDDVQACAALCDSLTTLHARLEASVMRRCVFRDGNSKKSSTLCTCPFD